MYLFRRRRRLQDLLLETRADKVKHNYGELYEAHLKELRDQPFNLLEIGVKGGGSLLAWEDYFPKARIFGIDVNPKCAHRVTARSRIFIGNQADPVFLESVMQEIGEPLDVIIDDGGHRMEQQLGSFKALFNRLRPGGWYIVEDIHTSYKPNFGGGPRGVPGTFIALLKT